MTGNDAPRSDASKMRLMSSSQVFLSLLFDRRSAPHIIRPRTAEGPRSPHACLAIDFERGRRRTWATGNPAPSAGQGNPIRADAARSTFGEGTYSPRSVHRYAGLAHDLVPLGLFAGKER